MIPQRNHSLTVASNYEMKITIGELDKKLTTDIFTENDPKQYLEREETLKRFINICFNHSIQLVELPHKELQKISFYKEQRIQRSLKRLSDYVGYLAHQLDKEKIIEHHKNQGFLSVSNLDIDTSFIIANSYYGSIKYDLYWIDNLIYRDALSIATGNFKIEDLSKYLPDSYSKFQSKILPYFKKLPLLSNFKGTLDEICKAYENKAFRACNLLILTSIEGIVRSLGNFLIEKQKLDIDSTSEFNSLDSFLRKIPWEKDYEISNTKYQLLTGDWDFKREGKDHLKNTQIDLKQRLDFLRRRFKEDRDLILHGLESDYGKEWHLFVNFSALDQVYETFAFYMKKYK